VIFLLFTDRTGAGIGMIGFGAIAGIADNVIRPWVMKDRDDIHPFISLLAIFGAIHFFGIFGVLVGPVVAACLIEFLALWPKFARELGFFTLKEIPKEKP
jgi:predicted PurR-regulated permease PerM